jgi:hypothetical protein
VSASTMGKLCEVAENEFQATGPKLASATTTFPNYNLLLHV